MKWYINEATSIINATRPTYLELGPIAKVRLNAKLIKVHSVLKFNYNYRYIKVS